LLCVDKGIYLIIQYILIDTTNTLAQHGDQIKTVQNIDFLALPEMASVWQHTCCDYGEIFSLSLTTSPRCEFCPSPLSTPKNVTSLHVIASRSDLYVKQSASIASFACGDWCCHGSIIHTDLRYVTESGTVISLHRSAYNSQDANCFKRRRVRTT